MVKVRKDLTGKTFGRLKVLEQADDYIRPSNGAHEAQWLCECSCEEHTKLIVKGADLSSGHSTSCGCWRKECMQLQMKKYNKYSDKLSDEYGDYYIGWTTNTNREFYVDADNYDTIKDYTWFEHETADRFSVLSAYDNTNRKKVKMHILLGYEGYDHIDHNELNNRRYNLRPATHQENMRNRKKSIRNTSGFIGVTWQKDRQKWIAQIGCDGKVINLGGYFSIEDAVVARLKAEKRYFGEFSPQIHLFEKYDI